MEIMKNICQMVIFVLFIYFIIIRRIANTKKERIYYLDEETKNMMFICLRSRQADLETELTYNNPDNEYRIKNNLKLINKGIEFLRKI